MARREWTIRLTCAHEGCTEWASHRYPTKRDMMESHERRRQSGRAWRCTRHTDPDEVMSPSNPETRHVLTVEQKNGHHYFGSFGFTSGPGFKAFAADLPVGAQIVVTATLVMPSAPTQPHSTEDRG